MGQFLPRRRCGCLFGSPVMKINVQLTSDDLRLLCDYLAAMLQGELIGRCSRLDPDDYAGIFKAWTESAPSYVERVVATGGRTREDAEEVLTSHNQSAELLSRLFPLIPSAEVVCHA